MHCLLQLAQAFNGEDMRVGPRAIGLVAACNGTYVRQSECCFGQNFCGSHLSHPLFLWLVCSQTRDIDAAQFLKGPGTSLQERYGYAPLVMVGDGATDAEARQPGGADVFIGYGGAVRRPAVAAAADWYVMSIQPLLDALH